jgi:2'-hydroxyisoflavone reductase
MRILVLGGTSFVGRAIVEAARIGNHDVTLFSRGRTGSDLFPGVPRLIGDRDSGDYRTLAGTSWDAVVDVSAYVPRQVREVIGALGDGVGRYLFISTGAVYDRFAAKPDAAEDSPLLAPENTTEEITFATYGPLKVACEDVVRARYGDQATVVRPGIVAGPHDNSDRFTYWVRRAARGGRVALTGDPDAPVQVVDSRDLAALVVALLVDDRPGTFNAVGPAEPTTLAGLIRICAQAAGSEVEVVTVPAETATPLPLVQRDATWNVMSRRSSARARAVGLPSTPLSTTAADVLAWDRDRGEPPLQVGPTAQQEADLLAAATPEQD